MDGFLLANLGLVSGNLKVLTITYQSTERKRHIPRRRISNRDDRTAFQTPTGILGVILMQYTSIWLPVKKWRPIPSFVLWWVYPASGVLDSATSIRIVSGVECLQGYGDQEECCENGR